MAGDAPRRSTRGASSKRTYVESDDEDVPEKPQPVKASKPKAAPKSRKPASKKTKKSADTIEDEDDEPSAEAAPAADAPKAEPEKEEAGNGEAAKPAAEEKGEDNQPAAVEEKAAEEKVTDTIAVGSKVPSGIKIADQEGNEVEFGTLTSEKPIVIFLVPKANTPGCTTQACNFRDSYKEFGELGYDVYSLSQDSPKALTSWKTSKELPYRLLSDPEQKLIRPLGGAKTVKTVQRSHYIIAKGGELLLSSAASPKDSAKLCLDFIKAL